MTASLARNISVYQCDVCDRRYRTPNNRTSFDVVQRCVVTKECKGKMHRVLSQSEVNKTPVFAPEVVGVQDWTQRSVLYTHYQPIATKLWVINHKLNNKPNLYVYIEKGTNVTSNLVKTTDYTSTLVDSNTTLIQFDNNEQGLVQCVTSMSQNTINPVTTTSSVIDTSIVPLTNLGELTIATASNVPIVAFRLTYFSPATPEPIYIEYINLSQPSLRSPWAASGSDYVVVNGKQYRVRSLNIATTQLAPTYFSTGVIVSGSTVLIPSVTEPKSVLILLSHPPHAAADRIYDQYIDAFNCVVNPTHIFFDDGELYADHTVIKNTYPPIIVV